MRPESPKLLKDALDAADAIERFVRGLDFDAYRANELVRSAVERQFEIVGEALAQLRQRDAAVSRRIPEVDRIVAFRNVLIHRYADVDDRLVWSVVERKLPALRAAVQSLLAE
ncbi:MAG: HepT-like ribonuclease domain-containing protein [Gemmatimonadales bacterium]|jgi:uncharacterized protein with HEPN domain